MVDRNVRKGMVLGLLLEQGSSVLSRDLVELWGLTPFNASMLLVHYQRQGLLHRDREPGPGPPVYRYRLNGMGRRKALWLFGQALEQKRLPGLELEPEVGAEPRVLRPPVHRARVLRPRIQRGG